MLRLLNLLISCIMSSLEEQQQQEMLHLCLTGFYLRKPVKLPHVQGYYQQQWNMKIWMNAVYQSQRSGPAKIMFSTVFYTIKKFVEKIISSHALSRNTLLKIYLNPSWWPLMRKMGFTLERGLLCRNHLVKTERLNRTSQWTPNITWWMKFNWLEQLAELLGWRSAFPSLVS